MPGDSLTARKQYLKTVKEVMGADSLYSLTSCNWTKEQLLDFFKEGKIFSWKYTVVEVALSFHPPVMIQVFLAYTCDILLTYTCTCILKFL